MCSGYPTHGGVFTAGQKTTPTVLFDGICRDTPPGVSLQSVALQLHANTDSFQEGRSLVGIDKLANQVAEVVGKL